MADPDSVALTDLEVIQQFSLAVRGATASRADVIAALEADLAYLRSGKAAPAKKAPVKVATKAPAKAPAKAATKAPAKKAPAKAARSRA